MTIELRPQEGPQEMLLASEADIVIYGGGAGGGQGRLLFACSPHRVSA